MTDVLVNLVTFKKLAKDWFPSTARIFESPVCVLASLNGMTIYAYKKLSKRVFDVSIPFVSRGYMGHNMIQDKVISEEMEAYQIAEAVKQFSPEQRELFDKYLTAASEEEVNSAEDNSQKKGES